MEEKEVFRLYSSILTEIIRPKKLITHLMKEKVAVITEICTELMKIEKDNPRKAAEYMLNKIESSDDNQKFVKLIAALKCSGHYEYLGELLEGSRDIKDNHCLQILIGNFVEDLRYIDPNDLVDDLCKETFLSAGDKGQILKYDRENQLDDDDDDDEHLCGMLVLVNYLAKRKTGWCTALLKTMKVKNNALAKKISKKLEVNLQDSRTESVARVCSVDGRTNDASNACASRPPPVGRAESPITTELGYRNHDIPENMEVAMNSDEEQELLQRAIRASISVQVDPLLVRQNQDDQSQVRVESSPMEQEKEQDLQEETSPKRHSSSVDSTLSSLKVNVQSGISLQPQSPMKKQAKLDEANDKPVDMVKPIELSGTLEQTCTMPIDKINEKTDVSLDELRRKRLARFAGDTSNVTASKVNQRPVISGQSEVSDANTNDVEMTSLKTEESRNNILNQFPHSLENNLCAPSTSSENYLQSVIQDDFELAKKLQEEEYSISQYGTQLWPSEEIEHSMKRAQLNDREKILNIKPGEMDNHRNEVLSDDENPVEEIQEEVLDLRPYQQELVDYAKERNTLIVAPTGSGKTHVALGISKAHFESMMDDVTDQPKIAFIVPTVALVEQQCKQYRKYICGSMKKKCIGVSGEAKESQKMAMGIIIDQYDIFVLTPQILVDALKNNEIQTLGIFTLLIFDECHHTMKDHPYNMVMHIYFQEKFCNQGISLPQIVGLTASVGVGKADKIESAVTHILTLCANLDSNIKTVQNEKKSLRQHVNTPTEDTHEVRERPVDPFKVHISKIMTKIEDMLKTVTGIDGIENESDFRKVLDIPAERGSERYTQWVNYLKQPVDQMYNQDKRRIFVTSIEDLEIYNNALMLNADCRTIDAFEYIEREFQYLHRRIEAPKAKVTDKWLTDIYKEKWTLLQQVSQDIEGKYKNPKLEKLKKVILDYYRRKPDSRGIIFCKTRVLTLALQNWITNDSEMSFLNPQKLVGSHTSEIKGGMTQRKIEDVLEYFKGGQHKLIIATTVAEEGLDISKCNLVIRYEHVTNETARIQAKGRGRAEDAEYILFGQEGGGTIEKDNLNKMRVQLMEQAIERINVMTEREYQDKIKNLQQKARINREMKKLGKERKNTANPKDGQDYVLRCNKCEIFACMASDVRKIEGSHHIVKDAEFSCRATIKVYPNPKTFKEQKQLGRMFCKECLHEWGTQTDYNSQRFYVIRVKGFLFCESNGRRGTFKQWKDVPFEVPNLSFNELHEMYPSDTTPVEKWKQIEVE